MGAPAEERARIAAYDTPNRLSGLRAEDNRMLHG